MKNKFLVTSSNGELVVSKQTGRVIKCDLCTDGEGINSIKRFDIEEYKIHHQKSEVPAVVDILDLGYFYRDGFGKLHYEEAASDWREMIVEMQESPNPAEMNFED